ncbi:Group II intron-encoded protein LtrA [Anatilimnocola aggregata]|uniref:Group II intron-encoded protein LtrA n=1 Tax=Anatilimnocola aggregata TaxID=2528021 RepID=A0A517YKA5_9BACT|nr:reverse transcriptase domain-containing protein [Anatilimnocola aggregata]QDU30636.1 Group II intron-encoded protein LtrA [Anatilimnocola aggregata]
MYEAGYTPGRPIPVGAHAGTLEDFAHRFQRDVRACHKQFEVPRAEKSVPLLEHWYDTRNLALALIHIQQRGGESPGPDGIRPEHYTINEWFDVFRQIQPLLINGEYDPSPPRKVEIAKLSGRGFRTIEIANLIDRIVARATYQWLWPWMEPNFYRRSYGFRSQRGTWHALREAVRVSTRNDLYHWLCHDLVSAFDRVPRNRLLDLLAWVPSAMLRVLSRLIDTGRKHGIPQGSALSPLLLNFYLTKHLDTPWQLQCPLTPMLRYADDILVLVGNNEGAQSADALLRRLLTPSGFQLRDNARDATSNLGAGESADWLGFTVATQANLSVRIGEQRWRRLERGLERASATEDGASSAKSVLKGWFDYLGPTYDHEDRASVLRGAKDLADRVSSNGCVPTRELRDAWRNSQRRWSRLTDPNPRLVLPRKQRQIPAIVVQDQDECPF